MEMKITKGVEEKVSYEIGKPGGSWPCNTPMNSRASNMKK